MLALITGGAFMEPSTMQFFYDLGIPVVNGYGLTEAGTALTLNDLKPFRADTVGKPLPGVELRILNPDADGVGEVAVRSKTVMSHYLDDPELTLETIVDGWLLTGDLGRFESHGHLQLFGRKKNMIVTEGGKNIYPEDIETVFDGMPVKEYTVFAANYVWPKKELGRESLVLVLAAGAESEIRRQVAGRDLGAQSPPARLQARRRIFDLGERFSAHCLDEDQAAGSGGRNRQVGWSGKQSWACSRQLRLELCRANSRCAFLCCIRGSRILGQTYLAIVNPAAGGGRSRKLLGPALERLQAGGLEVKVAETHAPGDATEIAREAYGRGVRNFIAVGGDGTSYEIVNGLFPQALGG